MDGNGLQRGMLGNGFAGLDMPQHQQNQQQHQRHQNQHQSQNTYQNQHQQQQQQQQPQHQFMPPLPPNETQSSYLYSSKSKQQVQQTVVSDEEEPQFTTEDGGGNGEDQKKAPGSSPWQRMKWTDNMIKLLIMAVYYLDEDGAQENSERTSNKKKSGGLMQKKGKWKSVSKVMMGKGFMVSPQQCEDKFNDLNKRYKRVNDILGKGIACKVVENQSLLESMDHVTPKLKEEVRKLLNSKHLFFQEMCAFHNAGIIGGCDSNLEPHPKSVNQQKTEGSKIVIDNSHNDEDFTNEEGEGTEDGHVDSSKRMRLEMLNSEGLVELNNEIMSVLQDGTKPPWQQQHWIRMKMVETEEQRVKYQYQAFLLEKQRMRWIKFCAQKEKDMERMRFENQRMKLESDRMVLLLRQKEFELIESQERPQNLAIKRSDSYPVHE